MHSLYRGRRRGLRRAELPGAGRYLDTIPPGTAVSAIAILLLSCADSLFTLLLLGRGAREVNPFMRYLIETDTLLFVITKTAITAACVLFIVLHRDFRFIMMRGYHALHMVLAMYLTLFSYQLILLSA